MIPSIVHQVWLGPKRIDPQLIAWAWTWRELAPGFDLVLWTDDPATFRGSHPGNLPWHTIEALPPLVNQWAYDNAGNVVKQDGGYSGGAVWACRSDIVRIEVVAQWGGIYADLDVELFRDPSELVEEVGLFVADEWGQVSGNYLFGARPNHPALWRAVRELDESFRPIGRRRSIADRLLGQKGTPIYRGILELTGPGYLARKLQPHPECVVMPWRIFSPLDPRGDAKSVKAWPECSYGCHHFFGTWYGQTKVPVDRNLCCPGREMLVLGDRS